VGPRNIGDILMPSDINSALDIARKIRRRKDGGKVHVGPVVGDTGGRADKVETSVENGSYVIPSETISHLGENNTSAGMKVLERMFPNSSARKIKVKRAKGGAVPVAIADGEFVVSPADAKRIGGGDLDHGHKVLDNWVMQMRQDHIKTLQGLDPPVKD
jgi:hypothetical protein